MKARFAIACLVTVGGQVTAAQSLSRSERLARKQLEAALAAEPSATKALQGWCAARAIGGGRIVAKRVDGTKPTTSSHRHLLDVAPSETVGFRHVRLECADMALSEAYNWYVPGRLTPAMVATLGQSDAPFGSVAAPLHFTRQPLASQHARAPGCPPDTILSHRALLRLPDGKPLALVVECYLRASVGALRIIPFDPPPAPAP